MTGMKIRSSRRAFFLSGGALVGAGVATAVGASALKSDSQPLDPAAEREAIRQLHLAFVASMAKGDSVSAAELFDNRADLERFKNYSAYRLNLTTQQQDSIALSEDRMKAAATFHIDVEICTPLEGDCTAAQMARLQGHVADRRWETGRFEATYTKTQGRWKVASLTYLAS